MCFLSPRVGRGSRTSEGNAGLGLRTLRIIEDYRSPREGAGGGGRQQAEQRAMIGEN